VQVARRRQAETLLQINLARRRVEQVGAAHDIGDPLRGVVHHYGELVRVEAVGAPEDEVAHVALQALRLRALRPVGEADFSLGFYPDGARGLSRRQAAAARAAVDARAVDGERRVGDLAARAAAGVGPGLQAGEGFVIQRTAPALVFDGT